MGHKRNDYKISSKKKYIIQIFFFCIFIYYCLFIYCNFSGYNINKKRNNSSRPESSRPGSSRPESQNENINEDYESDEPIVEKRSTKKAKGIYYFYY